MSAVTDLADVKQPTAVESEKSGWDWWLVATTALHILFGLLMMLSASGLRATYDYGHPLHFFMRQCTGIILGLAAGGVVLALLAK